MIDDSNCWRGPGVAIGPDGKIVLIRHGSIYIRVSRSRVVKFGEEFTTAPDNISNDDNSEKGKTVPKQKFKLTSSMIMIMMTV